jgi:predicted SAM-dependent methyltransferase
MKRELKQFLKRSDFLIGLARAGRAAAADLKCFRSWLRRDSIIRKYLATHDMHKLQVGTSRTPYSGWLNTDVVAERPDVAYLDATRPFPMPDASFDYIASEHMIEHVDYEGGLAMLRECFRILKPGGKIRLVTPDLRVMTALVDPETPMQKKYVNFFAKRMLPNAAECPGVFVLNNAFRAWGHQFLYDAATLKMTFARAGFVNCHEFKPGESDDAHLRGIEAHGQCYPSEDINQFESMVIEACKPPAAVKPAN